MVIRGPRSLVLLDRLGEASSLQQMQDVFLQEQERAIKWQEEYFHRDAKTPRKHWASRVRSEQMEERFIFTDFVQEFMEGLGFIEQRALEALKNGRMSYDEYDRNNRDFIYPARKDPSLQLKEVYARKFLDDEVAVADPVQR